MYFTSRIEAGYKLALELTNYRYENTVVVALNDGGVQVGQQIAAQLHCALTMLLIENIEVPGEDTSLGTLNQSGRFTYNGMLSAGEIEEYYTEFHSYLDDQRRVGMGKINQLLGAGGIVREDMLREQNVILVADGLSNGASLDAAVDFVKPLKIKRLIIAVPVAAVPAVDRMHLLADELHVLNVTDNYIDANHYYDVNDVPTHEQTVAALNEIVLNWR